MIFDPEAYTIAIRKEQQADGEVLYVGRVAEFSNISAYEDSFESARALVLDAIQTLKKIADETQVEFPLPYPVMSDEFSGRVTLRLPKTLHAKVSRIAAQEDVSVNQYLVTAVAYYVGETEGVSKVVSNATNVFERVVANAVNTAIGMWHATNFILNGVVTPVALSKPAVQTGLLSPPQVIGTLWPQLHHPEG